MSRDGLVEKDVNLEIALALAARLRADGVDTLLTRATDTQVNVPARDVNGDGTIDVDDDLQARVDAANAAGAWALVGIHNNAMPGSPGTRGTTTYYCDARPFSAESRRLAEVLQTHLLEAIRGAGYDPPDREARDDRELRKPGGHLYLLSPRNERVARAQPHAGRPGGDPVPQQCRRGRAPAPAGHHRRDCRRLRGGHRSLPRRPRPLTGRIQNSELKTYGVGLVAGGASVAVLMTLTCAEDGPRLGRLGAARRQAHHLLRVLHRLGRVGRLLVAIHARQAHQRLHVLGPWSAPADTGWASAHWCCDSRACACATGPSVLGVAVNWGAWCRCPV